MVEARVEMWIHKFYFNLHVQKSVYTHFILLSGPKFYMQPHFKLHHNLCFHVTNHNSKFRGQGTWLRCVQYM